MSRLRIALLILGVGLAALVARELFLPPESSDGRTVVEVPASGPITIAATGDTVLARAVDDSESFSAVQSLVSNATIALTNLDLVLLGPDLARDAAALPQPRWPFGSERDAVELSRIGIDVATLANHHALDYDVSGLYATRRLLSAAGVVPVGTGADLQEAGAASLLGGGPRRVAVIAVTTSFAPDTRATAETGTVAGRPGVHALRYDADVVVDGATFETLRGSIAALGAGPPPGDQELEMFGTRIRRGDEVRVGFAVNVEDQQRILDSIEAARRDAQVVIVSLHSHEPSNAADEPAAFVREFARLAVDRGASLIVGHGPHRLRGVERHGHGVILYSLGNFIYQSAAIDFRAADMFDASSDLYGVALGALAPEGGEPEAVQGNDWWTGAIAVAVIDDDGRVTEVRLQPIDLGTRRPLPERGVPELVEGPDSRITLQRIADLSQAFGTDVELDVAQGIALVR